MKSIPVKTLAGWASLSERRIRQLIEDGRLPAPVDGELPMPEAVKRLFGHYQGDRDSLVRERLLLTKAKRRLAERKLRDDVGGDLLPTDVVRQAAETVMQMLRRFGMEIYNRGCALDADGRVRAQSLADEMGRDFQGYIEGWIVAQVRQQKQEVLNEVNA